MKLSYQASHDPLTGLFNRREFEAQLHLLLNSAQYEEAEHVLCYLDLDQFKVVNDICGHSAGDQLLRQLSELLTGQIRDADILARLGGDEFGVLLTHCGVDQALRIAENIRSAIHAYRFIHEEKTFEVGASIGVVQIIALSGSAEELMSAADMACYAAKDAGRNRVHIYRPSDTELAERKGEMSWVSEVRMALDEDRFDLLCQPISTASKQVSRLNHFEVLLRMRKDNECVLPMAFLPAAERYNLMPEVDHWVVRKVIDLLESNRAFAECSVLLVNLSGQSLCSKEFTHFLDEQLSRIKEFTGSLCFEISEQAVIANQQCISAIIKHLKQLGCKVALDNFGGGITSMANLKGFQMDYVKISGGIIRNVSDDPIDYAMVRALNEVAHAMGAETIAEMIENKENYAAIKSIGIDYCQGHGIALPEPIELYLENTTYMLNVQ